MVRRQTSDYKAAELAGRRAEFLTKWLYHLAGYSCIAARQKTPFGELDLIMRRRGKILVLEVKYRHASSNVDGGIPTSYQLRRIRAAILWMSAGTRFLTENPYRLGWCNGWAGEGCGKQNSTFKGLTSLLSNK